jgi:hypothetical protein
LVGTATRCALAHAWGLFRLPRVGNWRAAANPPLSWASNSDRPSSCGYQETWHLEPALKVTHCVLGARYVYAPPTDSTQLVIASQPSRGRDAPRDSKSSPSPTWPPRSLTRQAASTAATRADVRHSRLPRARRRQRRSQVKRRLQRPASKGCGLSANAGISSAGIHLLFRALPGPPQRWVMHADESRPAARCGADPTSPAPSETATVRTRD